MKGLSHALFVCACLFGSAGSMQAQVITSFTPSFASTNEMIRIDGSGFTDVTTVRFFNNKNVPVTATADNQILVLVPAGATTGPVGVIKPGSNPVYSAQDFIVIGPQPYITNSPSAGAAGSIVTIYGVHFTAATAVKFNGVTASFSPPTTDSQLEATVPGNATTGPISITTSRGTGSSTNFFYVPPVIASFSPTMGRIGSNVVLTGKNFIDATSVKFQGVSARFIIDSPTQITATVPTNAPTGPITVTAPAGGFITSSNFSMLPTIYSFSPSLGQVGTSVTIRGANLNEGRLGNPVVVKFNGVVAPNPTISSNQITAQVPSGATTGPLSVTTTNGTTSTLSNFVVGAVSDLKLSVTVAPDPVWVQSNLVYTLFIRNAGPMTAPTVTVTNALPAGVTFLQATTTRGTVVGNNASVTAAIGDLPSNSVATVSITVRPSMAGTLTNRCTVQSSAFDSAPADNSVVTFVQALPQPVLSIRAAGGNRVEVSWPAQLSGFTLQTSEVLGPPNWANYPVAPFVRNTQAVITNIADRSSLFYRLRQGTN